MFMIERLALSQVHNNEIIALIGDSCFYCWLSGVQKSDSGCFREGNEKSESRFAFTEDSQKEIELFQRTH